MCTAPISTYEVYLIVCHEKLCMIFNVRYKPCNGNDFLQPFLVTGGGVILPPIVFRLYCPYLKISNGATHVIIGAKFISVVANCVSVQLNREFSTIYGLIAILKFVCCCSALSAI